MSLENYVSRIRCLYCGRDFYIDKEDPEPEVCPFCESKELDEID